LIIPIIYKLYLLKFFSFIGFVFEHFKQEGIDRKREKQFQTATRRSIADFLREQKKKFKKKNDPEYDL